MGSVGLNNEGVKFTRGYDLVEQMEFLFVRVVSVRDLPHTLDLYVEIKHGDLKATTTLFSTTLEWNNKVFFFEKDKINDSVSNVLVLVKNKRQVLNMPNAFLGCVQFNLFDVPKRVPQESSLAPQWYKLQGQNGRKLGRGDILLSLWIGTQADECFPHAWCSTSNATMLSGDVDFDADAVGYYTGSQVYISPTLWYLRVNVIQAQDLDLFNLPLKSSDIFVQVDLGSQHFRTKLSKSSNSQALWNEDLVFVAQEPFNDTLVLSVEQGTLAEHVTLGKHELHLKYVDKRLEEEDVNDKWYNLGRLINTMSISSEVKFVGKINARISLDGAYHVMDEPSEYCSDFRPSSRTLWNSSIGVLEVGIQKGTDLVAMKGKGRTDAYCVAKYGSKWVRTRTVVDSLSPKWNEQHAWEVYDPSTMITIAVFDNNQLDANSRARGARDATMGKIRIMLSTLDNGKVHTLSYPLVSLQPSGVKKMGEIHLAVRFSWSFESPLEMYEHYMLPLFPRHHYVFPLSPSQLLTLRTQPSLIIAQRFSRAEPPLRKEVVYYMLDFRSSLWSKRKAVANFKRIMNLIGDFFAFWKWLEDIKNWKRPLATLLFNFVCFLMLLFFPKLILPLVFSSLICVALKRYFKRPNHPFHTDAALCDADITTPEDLEEELDMFPTQLEGEPLTRRYDRLRIVAGNGQNMVNDLATLGEKLQALVTWRDPRATIVFLLFCVVGFLLTVTVPARITIFIWITYYLRHPRFRSDLPSLAENFIKRMPSKQAYIL